MSLSTTSPRTAAGGPLPLPLPCLLHAAASGWQQRPVESSSLAQKKQAVAAACAVTTCRLPARLPNAALRRGA